MHTPRSLAIALVASLAWSSSIAAPPPAPACAALCGPWQLDTAASDTLTAVLDQALARYKEPRPQHIRGANSGNLEVEARAADEASLGPILERPTGKALREELTRELSQAQALAISARGTDILIAADGHTSQQLTPGEPHARVDEYGTARIRTSWQKNSLVVEEKYGGSRKQSRRYTAQRDKDVLTVTQVIARPGLPTITFRSVYRRAAVIGLESTHNN